VNILSFGGILGPLQLQERKTTKPLHVATVIDDSGKGHFWGVWPIEKHWIGIRFWGLGKTVSCTKTDEPILTVNMSYDVFLRKELQFGVAMIMRAPALKFFTGVNFLIAINFLTR